MVKEKNPAKKLRETTSKIVQKKKRELAKEKARPKKSLSEQYLENEHRTHNVKKEIVDCMVEGAERNAELGYDSYSRGFDYDYFYWGRDSFGRRHYDDIEGEWLDCADAYAKEHIIPSLKRKFSKDTEISFSRKYSGGSDSDFRDGDCGAFCDGGSDSHSYQQYEIKW